ncbi:MAG: DUF167 domain-containing protein [Candidatus Omnitrophica bacterium]|jgi:hypothetical protein|nr:DUF167 domain-containing protein [Candidatus Omnitrophota bacterium]MDD5660871.1 DUF167 domain-containing protein [Candidatus Omnitrophota bacterium]
MIFKVRVNPGASRNYIEEKEGAFKVYLTKPACDGLANKQLVSLLSGHLKIKKYNIIIKSGERSRNKLIEVNDGSV